MMNFIFIYIFFIKLFCLNSIMKNNSNYKKNLIIGVVSNYKWEKVAPFIKSYAMSDFKNCDCVLFTYNMSKRTLNKIKSFGVIVFNIPEKYKNKKIINYRWKIYEDFLISNLDKYSLVLSVDVRDIFFQKDPFQYYNDSKSFLGIALEDKTLSHGRNKKWLLDAYGKDIHREIKHQRIICVGTVWGTIDKFIEFSKEMYKQLNSEWSLRLNVVEQAVGNYIIYKNKMFKNCLIKSENKDGPIMTIKLTKNKYIKFDNKYNVLNLKGEIAAIVHQYDRKPFIVRKVINKYCPEIMNNKFKNNLHLTFIFFFISIIFVLIKTIFFLRFKFLKRKSSNKY